MFVTKQIQKVQRIRRSLFNMSRFTPRVEIDGSNSYITVYPIDGKHSASMILMHGLGDSAEVWAITIIIINIIVIINIINNQGWRDTAEEIVTRFPHIKIILPTAPIIPVTLNMGARMPAWSVQLHLYFIINIFIISIQKLLGIT